MKNSHLFLIFIICLAFPFNGMSQETAVAKAYSFEQLEKAFDQEERPAIIFLHTEWCRYCKGMSESTFKNTQLVQLITDHFYFVPFDAESKKDVTFKNVKFRYKPTGYKTGIHELAQELLSQSNDKSYPVLVIINKNMEILYQYSGFLDHEEVTKILNQLI